jgi:site-specific DNA recombinase
MKSVIYARVSSKEQEETGYSLPSQEKFLKEYAERKGLSVVKVFSISESANGQKQRKIFNEMIKNINEKKIKIIICEKVDRLTRNFKDAVLINDWLEEDEEREIHIVKSGITLHKNSRSQEKLNWGVQLLFAKNHIDNLSEEVKKGQMEKIEQGWLPTKPPLGYKTIGESGHKIHIIDNQKAPLVKKMFTLYATNQYSLSKLTEKMYEEGLRTQGGNKLVKSRLADLLASPFYYGKIIWNNKAYQGKQEPLISEELFKKVQSIKGRKTTPKYSKHFHLFRGIIRCTECGGLLTWDKKKGIVYGRCNQYRKCSRTKYAHEEYFINNISSKLKELLIKKPRLSEWIKVALREHHSEEINYRRNIIKDLNQRKTNEQRKMSRLYDSYLEGDMEKDLFKQKKKEYEENINDIDGSIVKQSQERVKYFELGMNLYEISQKAPLLFKKGSPEDKRKLLSFIFSRIEYNKETLEYEYNTAFRVLSQAIKEINSSKEFFSEKNDSTIFEPIKNGSNKRKTEHFDSVCPIGLRG